MRPYAADTDTFYTRVSDDSMRLRVRCPKATALLNEAQKHLDEVLPAWPENGTDEWWLKRFLEAVVMSLGSDIENGLEASDDSVDYVHSRIMAGR